MDDHLQSHRLSAYASLVVTLLFATPAQSEELTGVWFVGGSVSDSPSAYAGAVKALPGYRLGQGFAVRAATNAGHYEYSSGISNINADYKGGEIALVYQASGDWGWANISAGPRFTDTKLVPFDPGNKSGGSQWDLGLQIDGARDGAKWRLGWFGSVAVIDEEYQGRIQLARKLNDRFRIGAETSVMGNPNYTKASLGGFVGLHFANNLDLQVSSGFSEQGGRGARAYGTVGLSQVF